MNTRLTIAAALAIASLSAVASAQNITVNADGERAMAVLYEDLNLANEAGQEALENRIASAVGKVCGDTSGRKPLAEAVSISRCMKSAKAVAYTAIAAKRPVIVVAKLDTARTR